MKYLGWLTALLIACLFLTGCLSMGSQLQVTDPVRRPPDDQAHAAVVVTVTCPEKAVAWAGSGVALTPHLVLTANHVVSCGGAAVITVFMADSDRAYAARVRSADKLADLAVIEIPDEAGVLPRDIKMPEISAPPDTGEGVCVATASPSRGWSCGAVAQKFPNATGDDVETQALIVPGNSGSGVYDSAGRLVGIVTKYVKDGDGNLAGGYFTSIAAHPGVLTGR